MIFLILLEVGGDHQGRGERDQFLDWFRGENVVIAKRLVNVS